MPKQKSLGTNLLLEHQRLLELVRALEALAEHGFESDPQAPTRRKAAALLETLVPALSHHFLLERTNLEGDFSDAPHLKRELEGLDEEHPQLLERFTRVQRALCRQSDAQALRSLLEVAIVSFLDHEAREDAVFAAD